MLQATNHQGTNLSFRLLTYMLKSEVEIVRSQCFETEYSLVNTCQQLLTLFSPISRGIYAQQCFDSAPRLHHQRFTEMRRRIDWQVDRRGGFSF